VTFDEWWEQAEKPFGEARGFKEAARAGWKARQREDAELCRRLEIAPKLLEAALEHCALHIEAAE
jgi:hypothetical protein